MYWKFWVFFGMIKRVFNTVILLISTYFLHLFLFVKLFRHDDRFLLLDLPWRSPCPTFVWQWSLGYLASYHPMTVGKQGNNQTSILNRTSSQLTGNKHWNQHNLLHTTSPQVHWQVIVRNNGGFSELQA